MRIGFDAKRVFHNKTGLGNYGRNLLSGLEEWFPNETYLLFTPTNPSVKFEPKKARVCFPDSKTTLLWRSFSIIRQLMREELEIYHGLSNEMPFSLTSSRIKSVVSIHDVIFKRYPSAYNPIDRCIYDRKTRFAVKNADLILTSSLATARDLQSYYHVNQEKVRVLFPSIEDEFFQQTPAESSLEEYDIPSDFFLFVGMGNERKNLEIVIEAMEHIPEKEKIQIIVVGGIGKYRTRMEKLVKQKRCTQQFRFINGCDNKALHLLYSKAKALIYSSYYEGFGMPIAEAMLCDCPVICSNVSSLPEAAGDAALYFSPKNAEQLSIHMRNVLKDETLRQECIEKGSEHRKRFNRKNLTHLLMSYYQELLAS